MTTPTVLSVVFHDKDKGPENSDVYFIQVKAKSGEHFSSIVEYHGKKYRVFSTVGKATKDKSGYLVHTLRAVLI